jgi:DHA2 family multidrug resistance protein
MAMSSGGLATVICMPIVGILISRVDGRYLIMFGFASIAVALFHMTSLNLQMSFRYAAVLRFYQSIGLAFLFVPINSMIYLGIDPRKNNDVSGLSNLARNIGGSAGTSFFTTVLARHQQVHQAYLVQNVVGSSQQWMGSVHALTSSLQHSTAALSDAQKGAYLRIYQSLEAQASVLSYIDVLSMLAVFCACMVPMALLMQKPPKGMQASAH